MVGGAVNLCRVMSNDMLQHKMIKVKKIFFNFYFLSTYNSLNGFSFNFGAFQFGFGPVSGSGYSCVITFLAYRPVLSRKVKVNLSLKFIQRYYFNRNSP